MDWRHRRQLAIFSVIVLFFAVIVYFIYAANREIPTCFDQRQNQNEEGVDCGGNCISCQLLTIRDIQTVWTKLVPVRLGSYDAAAFVKNPNLYFGTLNLQYEFELLDDKGASIALREGTTYLLPGEDAVIIEPDIRSSLDARTVNFKIRNVSWGRTYELAPHYDVGFGKRDYRVVENPQKIKQSIVETSIFNNTAEAFSRADAQVLLYDANKNVIAVNLTAIEDLQPGETRPITFQWPQEIRGTVDSIEGRVRINSFLR